MADNFMCNPGDFVVYPTHGVGKVVAIEPQAIAGCEMQLFVISFDRDRLTLRVPVTKADASALSPRTTRQVMATAPPARNARVHRPPRPPTGLPDLYQSTSDLQTAIRPQAQKHRTLLCSSESNTISYEQ